MLKFIIVVICLGFVTSDFMEVVSPTLHITNGSLLIMASNDSNYKDNMTETISFRNRRATGDTPATSSHTGSVFLLITVAGIVLTWCVFLMFFMNTLLARYLSIFLRWYLDSEKNKYYVNIGSFSISLFSGKMEFTNVTYITERYLGDRISIPICYLRIYYTI